MYAVSLVSCKECRLFNGEMLNIPSEKLPSKKDWTRDSKETSTRRASRHARTKRQKRLEALSRGSYFSESRSTGAQSTGTTMPASYRSGTAYVEFSARCIVIPFGTDSISCGVQFYTARILFCGLGQVSLRIKVPILREWEIEQEDVCRLTRKKELFDRMLFKETRKIAVQRDFSSKFVTSRANVLMEFKQDFLERTIDGMQLGIIFIDKEIFDVALQKLDFCSMSFD